MYIPVRCAHARRSCQVSLYSGVIHICIYTHTLTHLVAVRTQSAGVRGGVTTPVRLLVLRGWGVRLADILNS